VAAPHTVAREVAPDAAGPVVSTGSALSDAQHQRIRRRLREGRLSAREALYYSPLTNAPPSAVR
ncbi:MAG: hypothetical protein BWK77_00085, partial [Verrucomicrobia bacterium A1]